MVYPKVTVIWLNYNSMKFIDLVLESLDSLFSIDYPNYEVIIVDNNSTDGSFNIIKDHVKRKSFPKVKIIRLNKNIGYCGGNNVGFRARDQDSKYVVVLNNDAIVFSEGLRHLVDEIENDSRLGAIQGVIVDYNNSYIDTAGGMLDEILNQYRLFAGFPASFIKKPYYVTYAEGAFSLYRVSAILEVNRAEKMFEDVLFAYSDDVLLGLKLWNGGYRIRTIPIVVAKHKRSSAFGKVTRVSPFRLYLMLRNKLALINVTNSRYKHIAYILNVIRYFALSLIRQVKTREFAAYFHAVTRAIRDSYRITRALKVEMLDLYRAPVFPLRSKLTSEELHEYLRAMRIKYLKDIIVGYSH